MGRKSVSPLSVKVNLTVCRLVDTGNHIKASRLACSVRAKQPEYLLVMDVKAHIIYGFKASEMYREILY